LITAKVINGQNASQALRKSGAMVDSAVEAAVLGLAIKMTALVKTKLSGQVLQVRTGRLRRSINYKTKRVGNLFEATVGTNVAYGKTHELGLTIPAHIVEARHAKALRFQIGGKIVFAKRVNIPAVKMPQRSFLQASLDQMRPEIVTTLQKAVANNLAIVIRGAK
jgi:phage gpG-like protein